MGDNYNPDLDVDFQSKANIGPNGPEFDPRLTLKDQVSAYFFVFEKCL